MKRHFALLLAAAPLALVLLPSFASQSHADGGRDGTLFSNPSGAAATVTATGNAIDRANPFFQTLGTNGRACETCHREAEGWSISIDEIRRRFDLSRGLDPLFRTVDGSNSPDADVSTLEARRTAYSMLLTRGQIRVGLPVPPTTEFELIQADDPYGFAAPPSYLSFDVPFPQQAYRFLPPQCGTDASQICWSRRTTLCGPIPRPIPT